MNRVNEMGHALSIAAVIIVAVLLAWEDIGSSAPPESHLPRVLPGTLHPTLTTVYRIARAGLRPAPESRSRGARPHLLCSFTTRISFAPCTPSVLLQHTCCPLHIVLGEGSSVADSRRRWQRRPGASSPGKAEITHSSVLSRGGDREGPRERGPGLTARGDTPKVQLWARQAAIKSTW
jgi:hypothetical protein